MSSSPGAGPSRPRHMPPSSPPHEIIDSSPIKTIVSSDPLACIDQIDRSSPIYHQQSRDALESEDEEEEIEQIEDPKYSSQQSPIIPKRKPGRPPKQKQVFPIFSNSKDGSVSRIMTTSGNASSSSSRFVNENENAEQSIKRGRGRPKKSIPSMTDDDDDLGYGDSRQSSTSYLNRPLFRKGRMSRENSISAISNKHYDDTLKENDGDELDMVYSDIDTSSDMSRKKRRKQPIVEIPLMPLDEIRTYLHLRRDTANPNKSSRSRLPGIAMTSRSYSYEASEDSSHLSKKRRGSSPSYEDEHMEDEADMSEDEFESESDDLALRRSARAAVTNARGFRDEEDAEIADRIRARRPVSIASSPLSTLSSSVSDLDTSRRYYKGGKGKNKKSNGNMVMQTRRKAKSLESEDDFIIISGSSSDPLAGNSDLSDLSDYDKPKNSKRKGKGKGKSTGNPGIRITKDQLYTHRPFCEKCSREPADVVLDKAKRKSKQKNKKKRNRYSDGDEDADAVSGDELADQLQGWLECNRCVVSSHWGCLSIDQKKDVLADLREREGSPEEGEKPRRSVEIDESYNFVCAKCTLNPECFVCHEDDISQNSKNSAKLSDKNKEEGEKDKAEEDDDEIMEIDNPDQDKKEKEEKEQEDIVPKFRCLRCKQCVHYEHLEVPHSLGKNPSLPRIAYHYQNHTNEGSAWICHQCREWIWLVDIIIAWRPSPANAVEPELAEDEKAFWKDPLPREYLVKWVGRGFRHVTWVPHPWLQALSKQKLRNFLEKGPNLDLITDETLAAKGDEMAQPTIANLTAADDQGSGRKSGHATEEGKKEWKGSGRKSGHATEEGKKEWKGSGPGPELDAEISLPIEWSTIDRVLDIMLLPPRQTAKLSVNKRGTRILSTPISESAQSNTAVENGTFNPADEMRKNLGLKDGQEPPLDMQLDIDDWEEQARRDLEEEDVDEVSGLVTWCFVKWDDLQYDQSTWDTPPPTNSPLYPAFKHALKRFLRARRIDVPVLNSAQRRLRDDGAADLYVPPTNQPDCIVGGKLMPFQMEGFQWLLYKHFRRESCILADDMGLGKTIQIASVLGYLGSDKYKIYPCLVVVPNSTITNWVREFEKWVPHIRVVPYYGEAASRKVISKYELYHKGMQNKAEGLKAHVVLTTYDMITGGEFRVFKGIPRWEVLCIDEGQRLKSDNSLIFNRLRTLNTVHRILLTGTPLNNNLRELFNLLNFLDPQTFKHLEDLEKRFETLNESLVSELHEMIKPYILRRIKADVLKLPPKIEIIVPISLTPLQKQVYKGVFEKNAELIQAILKARRRRLGIGRC
ncbi:uncharacterized protein L201_003428 [Kwoniella dendrophila CBS 6074]|uniref:Helicase ATP-binding domain-containing protein n=1 Tax=Kwoniella dendrophila CBS 6074 TaxID=1295534 RepID=A0AAX4JSX1_9TREE